MSLFIVLEGGDGSGKTVQGKALFKHLKEYFKALYEKLNATNGKPRKHQYDTEPVLYTQEPGNTLLGQLLRRMLSHPDLGQPVLKTNSFQHLLLEPKLTDHALPDVVLQNAAPRAELLFFLLARAQLIEEVIQPHLSRNPKAIVICDRYIYSTIAYQGYGRGLDIALIEEANKIATKGIKPDLVILLDIAPEEGLRRKWEPTKRDFFDDQEVSFHQRVREGYLKQAKADPKRWLVVDATLPQRKVQQIIWDKVSQLL